MTSTCSQSVSASISSTSGPSCAEVGREDRRGDANLARRARVYHRHDEQPRPAHLDLRPPSSFDSGAGRATTPRRHRRRALGPHRFDDRTSRRRDPSDDLVLANARGARKRTSTRRSARADNDGDRLPPTKK